MQDLFEVVDDSASVSDSHVDNRQADNAHFVNGRFCQYFRNKYVNNILPFVNHTYNCVKVVILTDVCYIARYLSNTNHISDPSRAIGWLCMRVCACPIISNDHFERNDL